jgi:hypothetical protein
MVKNKRPLPISLIVIISCTVFFIFIAGSALAQKVIKYLPRDEAVEEVAKDYSPPLTKSTVACPAAFDQASRCFYCVNSLKTKCPDCCLTFSPQRAVRCSAQDNARYACSSLAFATTDCSPVANCGCPTANDCTDILHNCQNCPNGNDWSCSNIPGCQNKGCPQAAPKPSTGMQCIQRGSTSTWVCEEDNLEPAFTGCPTDVNLANCPARVPYDITPSTDCTGLSSPAPATCYEYTPTAEFSACIDSCMNYTDEWEKCTKRVYCCRQKVCGTGFEANCQNDSCLERVDWPECDNLDLAACNALLQEAIACIENPSPGSTCVDCFKEIDPAVSYKFVARSRESFVIYWQVLANTYFSGASSPSDIPTYFFTMVKIKDSKGNEVHRSIMHQKSFVGSFSVFSATSINSDIVNQGETYTVGLYYFMPQPAQIPGYQNLQLWTQIKRAGLIVMRTRE